jgi:hypothetical protein
MTIAFPTSGNYIDYADRWVDPALAFGAGLAEWLGMRRHSMLISPMLIDNQDGRLSSRQKEPFLSFWLTTGQKVLCQKLLYVSSLSRKAEAANIAQFPSLL